MEELSEILNVHKIWDYVIENLTNNFGPECYRNWFSKLYFKDVEDSQLVIKVPSNLVRDWVLNNYTKEIRSYWNHYKPIIYDVTILVDPSLDPNYHNLSNNEDKEIERIKKNIEQLTQDRDNKYDIFNIDLDPRFSFDNFVVGTSNQLAYAAARSVAESRDVQPGCNPLFLYGGVGLGKTHLMQAIAFYIKENDPTRKVIYLSAEKFMYQFIRALRDKSIMSFKEQFRSVDVLMIDDVQFICGKDSTQEEFFHTFNALIDNKRQMVISCDRSPSDLENMEERIRSRLGWGLVADVHSTNYELRYGILQAKIDQFGLNVPNEVIEFLAEKITSNVRELEGALNKVIAHSRLLKSPITIELTQQILSDLIRYHDKVITIDEIQKIVANHYEIRISDMTSGRRVRTVARPRQIAMYLSKKLTMKSLVEIGKKFGGKDHTTVMHAIKKVEDLIKTDPELAEDANILTRKLKL